MKKNVKHRFEFQGLLTRVFKFSGFFTIIIGSFSVISCTENNFEPGIPEPEIISASPVGDIVGKIVVGYQGWFGAVGDQSPFNSWRHWSATGAPAPNNQTFELYPDVREYTNTYKTGYSNLGNGDSAKLFSSWDDQTVNVHFKWMKEYSIHTAALQRFGNHMANDPRDRNMKDGLALKVKNAAEVNQIKFFIWYDISGWTDFQNAIKEDWINKMKTYTASEMYAKQNEKPVVCIWGVGVQNRPGDASSYADVINWFKEQGCYVIIGVAKNWRSDAANMDAYKLADMVSPWSVGTFKNLGEADNYKENTMKDDLAFLTTNNQDYLPVVFPGFAWSNWKPNSKRNEIPRLHGDFMWRQFSNIFKLGMQNSFVAMFDEYDEGTAIAKAAEDKTQIPKDQYFLTLDADSVAVSSDFYLRLTKDASKLLKREISLTEEHPTSHK